MFLLKVYFLEKTVCIDFWREIKDSILYHAMNVMGCIAQLHHDCEHIKHTAVTKTSPVTSTDCI